MLKYAAYREGLLVFLEQEAKDKREEGRETTRVGFGVAAERETKGARHMTWNSTSLIPGPIARAAARGVFD